MEARQAGREQEPTASSGSSGLSRGRGTSTEVLESWDRFTTSRPEVNRARLMKEDASRTGGDRRRSVDSEDRRERKPRHPLLPSTHLRSLAVT